ncbi:MAG TPA: CRTAC1 family protein, partial [Planctomycetota bacterium]|nr:CRTAC1 family protein [Planctomycetota bacterium]
MSQSPEKALRVQRYEDGWEVINRMIREDLSWGGYERNSFHVACDDGTFADISAPSGADYLEDGRALCVADFDRDGRPDLLLRNRNGPQVRILRNVWPDPGRAIWIRCEGRASNRSGIGARVTLHTPRGPRMKETCAGSFFLSQSSAWLCFGLGKESAASAESFRAEVRWPGGRVEDLGPLLPGRRYRVREGEGAAAEPIHVAPGTRLTASPAPEPAAGGLSSRTTWRGDHSSPATWLIEPIPAPPFSLPAADAPRDDSRRYGPRLDAEAPLFLHFVSISCPVCVAGCEETRVAEKLALEAGAGFLHVIVDSGSSQEDIRSFLARARFASPAVVADSRLLTAYNVVHRHLWNLRRDLAV